MADDFYPFVDSGDPAPDNEHITGVADGADSEGGASSEMAGFATRISIYDDMFSTPRVIVIDPAPVRTYLEEITNTVYRCMKEQGGTLSLMVIRELVENFIHAHFVEPIISILDGGNTIRFADQGPGIDDKERAFEFGVTSADRTMKRYIRGTGSGLPMVQQYLEAAGGAVSIENNLGGGTVVTVSTDPARVDEIKRTGGRGAAVRPADQQVQDPQAQAPYAGAPANAAGAYPGAADGVYPGAAAGAAGAYPGAPAGTYPAAAQAQAYPAAGATQAPQGYPGAAWPIYPAYPGYPQAAGWPPVGAYPVPSAGFPQAGHEFSTTGGYAGYPAPSPYGTEATPAPAADLIVSERGRDALAYLLEHGHAGPSELTAAFGQSGPTWSRELATLSKRGFAVKQGQKYYLTELGASWARTH